MQTHVYIYIYDAGLPHPPPPPHPMVSPLACQVGSCLVWPCCFPRLVLFGLPPPPCGVRPVVFLVGPAPPVGGKCVLQTYGMVAAACHRYVPCPLPPLWGGACGRFGWPRPACVGQCVLQRYVWYGCCRLLAVMSSLRARYHTKLLFSPCKRCPCPCCLCGAVCSTKICMVWLLPLVSSNVIATCSLPYKIALFSLQTVPLSLLPVWGSVFYKDMYGMVAAAC